MAFPKYLSDAIEAVDFYEQVPSEKERERNRRELEDAINTYASEAACWAMQQIVVPMQGAMQYAEEDVCEGTWNE